MRDPERLYLDPILFYSLFIHLLEMSQKTEKGGPRNELVAQITKIVSQIPEKNTHSKIAQKLCVFCLRLCVMVDVLQKFVEIGSAVACIHTALSSCISTFTFSFDKKTDPSLAAVNHRFQIRFHVLLYTMTILIMSF